MTAKKYLSEIQRIQTMIEQKRSRIKEYRHSAATVSSMRYDVDRTQGGKRIDKIGDIVSKIADLETEVQQDIADLLSLQHEIIHQIQSLKTFNHVQLLCKRYIEGKKLQVIADEMCYTYEYIRELHCKALKAFAAAYPEVLHESVAA